MEQSVELQVAHAVVKAGLLSEKELQQAIELQKKCTQYQMSLPLAQIILQKYATVTQARQQYLVCLVQELEIPELRPYLDPFSMELFPAWKNDLAESEIFLQNAKVTEKTRQVQTEMKKLQIDLGLPHLALLMQGKTKHTWAKTPVAFATQNRDLNLDKFCERTRNNELLAPNVKISKLCGSLLRMSEIEELLTAQKQLEKLSGFKIPLLHLLIHKYRFEPYLLHALLLAQINWDDEEQSFGIWWGGVLLQKAAFTGQLAQKVQDIQETCQEFLESCFLMAWLEFSPEKEFALVEYLEKKLNADAQQKAQKLRQQLEGQLSLSFLKLNFFGRTLTAADLVEGVLTVLYKMTPENVAKVVAPIKEAAAQEKPAKKRFVVESGQAAPAAAPAAPKGGSGKLNKQLGQTMTLSKDQLGQKNRSAAAARIMERLQNRQETPAPPAAASPAAVAAQPTSSQPSGQPMAPGVAPTAVTPPAKPAEVAKERPKTVITLSEDFAHVREALAQKMVKEESVIEALLAQSDMAKEQQKPLLDILQERHSVTKTQYSELHSMVIKEQKVEVSQAASDIDLLLAGLIMDYNMLPRDRIQRILRLQNSLYSLGIVRPLDNLLVTTKTLAPDMVTPLVSECQRRKEGKPRAGALSQTMRVDQKALRAAPAPTPSAQDESAAVSATPLMSATVDHRPFWQKQSPLTLVGAAIACLLAVSWAVSAMLAPRKPSRPSTPVSQPETPQPTPDTPKPKNDPARNDPARPVRPPVDDMATSWQPPSNTPPVETKTYVPPQPSLPTVVYYQFNLKKPEVVCQGQALTLRGELSVVPPLNGIKASVQLWDGNKEKSYKEVKSLVEGNTLSAQMGLRKPLQPGVYFVGVAIVVNQQETEIRNALSTSKDATWWLPFTVGDKKELGKAIAQIGKDWAADTAELRRLYEELQKTAQEPLAQTRNKWRTWSGKWQKKLEQVREHANNRLQTHLIPVSAPIEETMLDIVRHMQSMYEEMDAWVQGMSLIPPENIRTDKRFPLLETSLLRLTQERNQALLGLVSEGNMPK